RAHQVCLVLTITVILGEDVSGCVRAISSSPPKPRLYRNIMSALDVSRDCLDAVQLGCSPGDKRSGLFTDRRIGNCLWVFQLAQPARHLSPIAEAVRQQPRILVRRVITDGKPGYQFACRGASRLMLDVRQVAQFPGVTVTGDTRLYFGMAESGAFCLP